MEKDFRYSEEMHSRTCAYLFERRKDELQRARRLLEIRFGMSLTLGDRMLLRGCFFEVMRDFQVTRSAMECFRPFRESAARYLLKYHDKNMNEIWPKINS